ncbi:MAG: hypothetical protein IT337_02505 [Thermomicrobiales bacterium]|nr:hypothetical protein [Thermomicrobiales bacterium]
MGERHVTFDQFGAPHYGARVRRRTRFIGDERSRMIIANQRGGRRSHVRRGVSEARKHAPAADVDDDDQRGNQLRRQRRDGEGRPRRGFGNGSGSARG